MATAAFLTAWRRSGRKGHVLVKVQLTDPTTRTLYLSTSEVATPGTPPQVWEGVLTKAGPIQAPGSFGSRTLDLCTTSFELPAGGRLAYQTGTAKLVAAFKDYNWQGAAATVYFWEGGLTDFADAQQQLPATVQTYKVKDGVITVHLIQRADNREVPAEVVGVDKYPRAPEKSRGRVPPICYGRLTGMPLRVPAWTAEFGSIATGHHGLEHIAGGRRAIPGAVVDIGRGGDAGGATKVVFAGHPVKTIGDTTRGTTIWMEQDGKLCHVEPEAILVNICETISGNSTITRASGSFVTDGVQVGSLVLGAIAARFPAGTKVTVVAAATLTVDNASSSSTPAPENGSFSTDIFNDATDGAGFKIGDKPSGGTDPFTTLFIPVLPSNVELVAADNAENPRAVLDPFNDTSYARLEYGGGGVGQFRELRVRFPSLPEAGDLVQADIEVGVELVSGTIGTNVNLRVDSGGANFSEITLPTPSPNPGYVGMNLGTTWGVGGLPSGRWEFGNTIARIYFAASQNAILRVYAIGLTLRVRPTGEIIADKVVLVPTVVEKRERGWLGWNTPYVYTTTELLPGIVPVHGPLLGPFAANLEGYADDASGTDTGIARAVIERAPDILRHLLKTYGGLTAADIEIGASTFGSLAKLRDDLKTWRQLDMSHAFAVLERTPIHQLVEALASDSMCWFHFNRFDGKLHGHSWRAGKAPDYGRKIPKEWISEGRISLERAPGSEVVVSTRVSYSLDHVGKNMLHEVTLGPGRSSAGHRWRGIRDQQMTVIASGLGQNNKLNFTGVFTATLDAGDYTPIAFAQHVATKMDAAAGTSGRYKVAHGFTVVAGYNDTIPANDGAPNISTILPGTYSGEGLAVAVAAALNLGSSNWGCTYSRSTRKFTITRTGMIVLNWSAVAGEANRKAATLLGYDNVFMNSSPAPAHRAREEDMFAIGTLKEGEILEVFWETGADGLNAGLKNCAALLGFDTTRNSLAVTNQSSQLGHSPKGGREVNAKTARDKYGGKREWSTPGTTIQDTDTAREVSLRAFDLFSTPRAKIGFASGYVPDLERGRVIEFEAGVDDLGGYPVPGSDGSWAGKRFMVIETQQNMIPDSLDTEVVAVEV